MKRILVVLVVLCASVAWGQSLPDKEKVAEQLQEMSVTIRAGMAQGSGTMVIVPVDGKPVTFCWTAGHVIQNLRDQKEVVAPDGSKRHAITFRDPEIVQEESEDGSRVGERKMLAKVVVYSERDDLALLRIRKKGFARVSAVFYDDAAIPRVGTDLYHCGSPGGQEIGANSVTPGIVAQVGRIFPELTGEFDQVTCAALPGSSGGGVFLRDGRYIGMLTMGVRGADSFHYIIPVRRMKAWAEKVKVAWALGIGKPPTEDELSKIAIEDPGATFKGGKQGNDASPFEKPSLDRPVLDLPAVLRTVGLLTRGQ